MVTPDSPDTMTTSLSSTCSPTSASSFCTSRTSPTSTRWCVPPDLTTAYTCGPPPNSAARMFDAAQACKRRDARASGPTVDCTDPLPERQTGGVGKRAQVTGKMVRTDRSSYTLRTTTCKPPPPTCPLKRRLDGPGNGVASRGEVVVSTASDQTVGTMRIGTRGSALAQIQ